MESCKTVREYEKKFEKINKLSPTKLVRYPSIIDIDLVALRKKNDKMLELFKTTSKFY